MVLCYNLTRVLSIVGLEQLMAWLADVTVWPPTGLPRGVLATVRGVLKGIILIGNETSPISNRLPARDWALRSPDRLAA